MRNGLTYSLPVILFIQHKLGPICLVWFLLPSFVLGTTEKSFQKTSTTTTAHHSTEKEKAQYIQGSV